MDRMELSIQYRKASYEKDPNGVVPLMGIINSNVSHCGKMELPSSLSITIAIPEPPEGARG